jgi:hypothetical protein
MSAVDSPAIVLGSSESFVDSVVKVAGAFKKMSSDKIMKKIQGLEETLESLRQQLVQSRSEDIKPTKKEKVQKQKQEKETKTSTVVVGAVAVAGAVAGAVAEEKEKEKVPMPWTGLVDFATCVGLKAQYGLFLQCGKTCDPKSRVFTIDNHDCRFCSDCVKKCDEQGNHPVGTMDQRIEAGVGKYVNAKTGKKETLYIDALEKMGITKEEALAAAEKRGFQIPDWMLEKAEKKRGRPSSKNVGGGDGSASSENGSDAEKKPKQQIKKVKKTASAITTDTPQKMIPDSAESESLVDAAADAADAHEKKKRGRPSKTITKKNVAESEMQQLIVQATAEKKKRLSFGPDIYTPLAATTTTVVEPAFHGDSANEQTRIAVNINFDEIADEDGFINFDNFGDQEDNNDNNQDQKEQQEQEQIDVATVAAVAALPSLAGKVGGGNHPSHPDCVESALDVAVEKKKDKSDKKESKKKESKKKDSEKKESKKKDKSEKKEKKESEKKKEPEPEKKKEEVVVDEEEEEELECEEYEYEGETYGLAPNGDIYSQDGDLVGKVTDGVTKMFN